MWGLVLIPASLFALPIKLVFGHGERVGKGASTGEPKSERTFEVRAREGYTGLQRCLALYLIRSFERSRPAVHLGVVRSHISLRRALPRTVSWTGPTGQQAVRRSYL